MASRRNLKKTVNYIITDLYSECLFQELLRPEVKQELVDDILEDIFKIRIEFVSRISHTEPGNVKGYYKNFKENFSKEVTKVIAKISALN